MVWFYIYRGWVREEVHVVVLDSVWGKALGYTKNSGKILNQIGKGRVQSGNV